jgi:hypothetical protein
VSLEPVELPTVLECRRDLILFSLAAIRFFEIVVPLLCVVAIFSFDVAAAPLCVCAFAAPTPIKRVAAATPIRNLFMDVSSCSNERCLEKRRGWNRSFPGNSERHNDNICVAKERNGA